MNLNVCTQHARRASVPARPFTVLVAALCLLGCDNAKITSDRVPKEKKTPTPDQAHGHGDMHGHRTVTPRAQLEYQLPAGWKEAAASRMSVASFILAGEGGGEAQLNITPLPSLAGREAGIVNMWRQQAGLSELSDDEAAKTLKPVEVAGEQGKLFELTAKPDGTNASATILTAMVHRPDGSWFYKLTGDTRTVEAHKPAFIEFLKSVRVREAPAPAAQEAMAPQAPPATESSFKWKVPAQWKPLAAGAMQAAKFAVPQRGDAKAEVSVSVFGNDTGGTLGNVNRWRSQIGLPPVAEPELKNHVTILDPATPQAFLVDLKNNDQQLIAAVVPRQGQWFFYKLMGHASAVAPEKDAFVAFVKSEP
jgi:hypothetical protein